MAAPDSVVIVEEIGELADGIPYLTMEYLDGMPLSSRLERMRHRKERMREHEVARIGLLVACAMDKVHKAGVIHRDLKPENLMLVPSGGVGTKVNFVPERIKILDFGIAVDVSRQQSGQPRLTSIGSLMGTWAYMPPEQVDATQVTAKADVHALGCILYELLGGHLPIVRPLKSVLCSPRMTELLTRMTAQVAANRPTMGLVVPRLEELSRNRNRTSLAPILIIALVVLAIGLLLTFIITSGG
jgi:serine/threonine protein kinase